MYALRDCVDAGKVWACLVPPNLLEEFYSCTDCTSWVGKNLQRRWCRGSQNDKWKYAFCDAISTLGEGEIVLSLII